MNYKIILTLSMGTILASSLYCAQNPTPAKKSFVAWAQHFFNYQKERCGTGYGPATYPEATVPLAELLSTIDKFSELLQQRLGKDYEKIVSIGKSGDRALKNKFPQGTYLEKTVVPLQPNTKLIVIGDLHSSAHSLTRNILRLIKEKILDDTLRLSDNAYLFFTGDLGSRGSFGAETWYLAATLALQNPDKVFVARGNHEFQWIFEGWGFKNELDEKYTNESDGLIQSFLKMFKLLPGALYVGRQNDWIQVNHALVALNKLSEINKFLLSRDHISIVEDGDMVKNFFGGQCRSNNLDLSNKLGADTYTLETIKDDLDKTNIRAIVRGHDHNQSGICTCPKNVFSAAEETILKSGKSYPLSFSPVYTLMSAPDGLASYARHEECGEGSNVDSYLTINVGDQNWKQWTIVPFSEDLPKTRFAKKVHYNVNTGTFSWQ